MEYTKEKFDAMEASLKAKVDEFRTNNVTLMKDFEGLKTKFDGIDVDEYKKMLKAQSDGADKDMFDAGKIDELVARKVKDIQAENAKAYSTLEGSNNELNRKLEVLLVDGAIKDTAVTAGVLSGALDDVVLRAKSVFRLKDGTPTAVDSAGNTLVKAGSTTQISMKDWVSDLTKSAPHLFEKSSGSGSQHDSGSGKGGEKQITRKAFDAMSQVDRSTFAMEGGKVSDA